MGSNIRIIFQIAALFLPLIAAAAPLQDNYFQFGIRFGLSEDTKIRQCELTIDRPLPWDFSPIRGWRLGPGFEGALGWIGDDSNSGVIASVGPTLRIRNEGFPVCVVGGFAPTVIGRQRLGDRNLGSAVQFNSHIGFAFEITDRWAAVYRFQHMSNGGLAPKNPGVNMHMIGLSWRF